MTDTAGFYKIMENNQMAFGSNGVSSLNYDLHRQLKDTYLYPVDGWYWFDTEEEARIFFNIPAPAEPTA